jgi:uncharacterized protein YcfJ
MKNMLRAIPAGLAGLVISTTAVSGHPDQEFMDTARVVQADPLYETVAVAVPVRECWTETVTRGGRDQGSYTAPIAGGIVGGLLGNRLGRGHRSGRTVLTVAGTLLGASIGNDLRARSYRRPLVERVRRCETVDHFEEQQQLVGYRVEYRYEGQTFTTRTTEHPGEFIRVRVNVDPVDVI